MPKNDPAGYLPSVQKARANQDKPKKPGLVQRERELASAERERNQYVEERGGESARTGGVETRQRITRAKENLRRLRAALKARGD